MFKNGMEKDKMGQSPGKRLHQARELMGISRSEFADQLGFKYLRLVTIENDRGRMSVDDLAAIVRPYPELTNWLLLGEELNVGILAKSSNEHIRTLADNLESHGLPEV
jgi:transcriptional regulator with XRE-family HTH domain